MSGSETERKSRRTVGKRQEEERERRGGRREGPREGEYSRRELLTVHCLYEPPESRHTPCPPSFHRPSLPCVSLFAPPRQIAYDVPLMKRSTKPASSSSDLSRRDPTGGRQEGGEKSRARIMRRRPGCILIYPATAKGIVRLSFRGGGGRRSSFNPPSPNPRAARTFTAGRFEGYRRARLTIVARSYDLYRYITS